MTHLLNTPPTASWAPDSAPHSRREVLRLRGVPEGRFVRLWSGPGTEWRCESCGHTIESDEIEYELEFRHARQTITIRVHLRCWENWHLEDSLT